MQVQTFLLGGYETTANAISFAVHCMATNPEGEFLYTRQKLTPRLRYH